MFRELLKLHEQIKLPISKLFFWCILLYSNLLIMRYLLICLSVCFPYSLHQATQLFTYSYQFNYVPLENFLMYLIFLFPRKDLQQSSANIFNHPSAHYSSIRVMRSSLYHLNPSLILSDPLHVVQGLKAVFLTASPWEVHRLTLTPHGITNSSLRINRILSN